MGFVLDTPLKTDVNVPRASNPSQAASVVPPGMGELNYIQLLLQSVLGQGVDPEDSPTFVGLTLSGLTASALVYTDANKTLASVTLGGSLSLSTGTLNTIQAITATSNPTFAGLYLSGLTASVPVVTSALNKLASQTYADFKTSLVLAQADIDGLTTGDSPTFTGLTLSGVADGIVEAIDGALSNTLIGDNLTWTEADTGVTLLHFDGADESTTFTDEYGRSWAAQGGAKIDDTQSVFGGTSGYFDGSGDYISTTDVSGFDFGTGDFTIEFRMRTTNLSVSNGLFSIGLYSGNNGVHARTNGTSIIVYVQNTSYTFAASLAVNTWYAIAICRASGVIRVFKDGTQVGSDTASVLNASAATSAWVGRGIGSSYQMVGWIDEFRVSNTALYTANYTPAAGAFTPTLGGLDTVQDIQTTSSPTFAGLTLTAFSGFVKATAGVLSAAALAAGDIPDISATYVPKSLFDAHTILYATTDNTPAALTVTEQTLVGRVTGGNITAISIDADLSAVSANDDTIPSAKAT
ncbi:MAG: LamG domain-containing protein, partial [Thermodesulfobacteriota bacterium]